MSEATSDTVQAAREWHALDIANVTNLADYLDEDTLTKVGNRVIEDYEVDRASMKDWVRYNEVAMKLVCHEDNRAKQDDGLADAKLPLVMNAAIRASAEEFPEIVRSNDLVKTVVFGKDDPAKVARGQRVAKRMNYQFFHEMENWVDDHDRLVLCKNILGCVHKKLFYCKEKGTIESALRLFGVVVNNSVRNIDEAPRVTDEIELFWWQVEEKVRSKQWRSIPLPSDPKGEFADSDRSQMFLEQVRREDFDGDGYPEPYVVTVHKSSRKVVRIMPNFTAESLWFEEPPKGPDDRPPVVRIDPTRSVVRYVKYWMIPAPDGSYWAWGLGRLLGPLNDNCNALVNELIDAGAIANNGGGFLSQSLRLGKGAVTFRRNEWKTVPVIGGVLKDSVMPLPVRDPSSTLFSLLGLLMDSLRDLSMVSRVMSGEQPKANMPGVSVLALIEQGKKAFGSVYKRHYLALSREALALFDLDYLYESPEDYRAFLDDPVADPKKDFTRGGIDLLPTALPEFSTRIQRMAEAEALLALQDNPRVNGSQVVYDYVVGITDDEERARRIVPLEPNVTPEQMIVRMQAMREEMMTQLEVQKAQLDLQRAEVELQVAIVNAQRVGAELPARLAKVEGAAIKTALQVEGQRIQNEQARQEVTDDKKG